MQKYLPYIGFKWLDDKEIEKFDVTTVSDTNLQGHIFEVYIEYPDKLHNHHKDLPFLPERGKPSGSKLEKFLTNPVLNILQLIKDMNLFIR